MTATAPLPLAPIPLAPLPEHPLVSVLVSCYNYERFVVQAVQSALDQTHGAVEVIVVDDGSDDGSADRVEAAFAGDARVHLVRQPNAGQGAAMNTAYEMAQGEVLCFLDADDTFRRDKLARVVQGFRDRPQAGYLVHGFDIADADGAVIATRTELPEAGWQAGAILGRGGGVPASPPTSAMALRRAAADVLFPVNARFRIATDALIQRTAPLVTGIAAVPEPLMRYRVHGANHFAEVAESQAGVQRMAEVAEVVHGHQRAFLAERYGDAVAERLGALADDWGWLGLQTQMAFLSADRRRFRAAVRSLAAHPDSARGRQGTVARVASVLPPPLDRALWRLFYGEGLHKQALRTFRRARSVQ